MHVTRVLFLVWFNNFALTVGVTRSYLSHSFVCTLAREMLHHPEVSLSKYVADKLKGQHVYSYIHIQCTSMRPKQLQDHALMSELSEKSLVHMHVVLAWH